MFSRDQEKLLRILRAAIISSIILVPLNQAANYDGYKLYRLYPDTLEKIALLKSLDGVTGYDFWQEPRYNSSKLMVAPQQQSGFDKLMTSAEICTAIVVDDVAVKMREDARMLRNQLEKNGSGRRSSFDRDWRSFSFDRYLRYTEMLELVKAMVNEKSTAKLLDLGQTPQRRKMFGVKLSTSDKNPTIVIDAGIHGREWAAPMAVLYILKRLMDNEEVLKNITFVITPLANPDGYEHTHENDRLWRKTMSSQVFTDCVGVDINRNFGSHWREFGAQSDACSPVYAGIQSFSETESRSIALTIEREKPVMYLTFHAFGGLILHPWGFTTKPPRNGVELESLGKKAAAEVEKLFNTQYKVGSSAKLLYLASGASDDWAMENGNVPLAYCIELEDFGFNFDLPTDKLKEVSQHAEAILQVFINHVNEKYRNLQWRSENYTLLNNEK